MKKSDILFIVIVIALFAPFLFSSSLYESYQSFNAAHGMVMSFLKFAILSTLGELLGLRISSYTDLILMKLYRTKQIEDHDGQTLVSEGIGANYMDMVNYALFGLIKLEYGE